ncbi:MAG: hypothetical protein QM708_00080 [Propioniciclava sp.]|uniref:hypothetical protein n=1 Tax=Propioniciclava sp. TaxID=2038686 RepID=UPI0039E430BA
MASSRRALKLGVVDQGVVSLGSILFLICAAQGMTPDALGLFAIALSSVLFVQSVLRAFIGEVLIVGKALGTGSPLDGALSAALGGALVSSAVFAILAFAVPPLAPAFAGAAFAAPGIVAQDLYRFHYIAERESSSLLTFDLLAVITQATGILLAARMTGSPLVVAIAWSGGAGMAALISTLRVRPSLSASRARDWLVNTWSSGLAYATEAIIGAAAGYAITMALAAFHAPSETATFRIAMSVFGLSSLLINFARSTLVRETRTDGIASARIWPNYWKLGLVMMASVLLTWAVVLLLPQPIGIILFGESWASVVAVAVAVMVNRVFATWSVVPSVFLRAMGVTWPVTRIRVVVGFIAFGVGPVGAALGGVTGAFLGDAFMYLLLWISLTVLLARRKESES